jgi:DNA polymerase-3 subunit delta'
VTEGQHPDVARIAPEGEFTRIWQLWSRPGHPEGALESLPFAPIAGARRVYLFERAETLNEESANSLLKALEEPPPYVQFILCAPSVTAVLPTILSRCRQVRFGLVTTETIAEALASRFKMNTTEARTLAAYSQGAPGRAFRIAENPELRDQREALLNLAERIGQSPGIAAFKLAEELRTLSKGGKGKKSEDEDDGRGARGDLNRALEVLAAWYSDVLTIALRGADAPVVHEERRTALQAAAARYRTEQLIENLESLRIFHRHIARNANAQLATETLLLRLTPKKG